MAFLRISSWSTALNTWHVQRGLFSAFIHISFLPPLPPHPPPPSSSSAFSRCWPGVRLLRVAADLPSLRLPVFNFHRMWIWRSFAPLSPIFLAAASPLSTIPLKSSTSGSKRILVIIMLIEIIPSCQSGSLRY